MLWMFCFTVVALMCTVLQNFDDHKAPMEQNFAKAALNVCVVVTQNQVPLDLPDAVVDILLLCVDTAASFS